MDSVIVKPVNTGKFDKIFNTALSGGDTDPAVKKMAEEIKKRNNGKFSEKMADLPFYDYRTGDPAVDCKRMLDNSRALHSRMKFAEDAIDWQYVASCFMTKLMFIPHMIAHEVTEEVNKKVLEAKVDFVPSRLPEILDGAFIIEKKEFSYLFKDVVALYGYRQGDWLFVNILRYLDDGKGDVDEHNISLRINVNELLEKKLNKILKNMNFVDEEYEILNKKRVVKNKYIMDIIAEGIKYIVVLGFMMRADKTPVEVGSKFREMKVREQGKKVHKGWIERYVYLNKKYVRERTQALEREKGILDKEGKTKEEVVVHGYLRQQAYGKNREERKLIWIEEFKRNQWVVEGNIKYIVSERS